MDGSDDPRRLLLGVATGETRWVKRRAHRFWNTAMRVSTFYDESQRSYMLYFVPSGPATPWPIMTTGISTALSA